MESVLDNVFWHAMVGAQAGIAAGSGSVRRYARGFSPIAAFVEPQHPDFAGLAECFEPGERFYTDAWSGPVPPDWRLEMEAPMEKMIWAADGLPDDTAPEAVRLGPEHAAQALALAELTRPGPFGLRTIEMGTYFGTFESGSLVAMAGERAHAAGLREVSGICTDPRWQGRGLAKRLTAKVLRHMLERGETPFLHVVGGNRTAHDFYRRLGFRDYRTSVVRVLTRV